MLEKIVEAVGTVIIMTAIIVIEGKTAKAE